MQCPEIVLFWFNTGGFALRFLRKWYDLIQVFEQRTLRRFATGWLARMPHIWAYPGTSYPVWGFSQFSPFHADKFWGMTSGKPTSISFHTHFILLCINHPVIRSCVVWSSQNVCKYIIMSRVLVTYRRGWDWWIDLLDTHESITTISFLRSQDYCNYI
jgi:hypothetical protein